MEVIAGKRKQQAMKHNNTMINDINKLFQTHLIRTKVGVFGKG